jgi:hypothetical protein
LIFDKIFELTVYKSREHDYLVSAFKQLDPEIYKAYFKNDKTFSLDTSHNTKLSSKSITGISGTKDNNSRSPSQYLIAEPREKNQNANSKPSTLSKGSISSIKGNFKPILVDIHNPVEFFNSNISIDMLEGSVSSLSDNQYMDNSLNKTKLGLVLVGNIFYKHKFFFVNFS